MSSNIFTLYFARFCFNYKKRMDSQKVARKRKQAKANPGGLKRMAVRRNCFYNPSFYS